MANADDEEQAGQAPAEPGDVSSQCYDRWSQIGRSALLLEGRSAAVTLHEILEQCAVLIIHAHWIANDRNNTKTAEVLGIGRKRVGKVMDQWLQSQTKDEGSQK